MADMLSPQGHIFQINVSGGGVPKLPIRRALVTPLGLAGDSQRNLHVHGGPSRALCLFSLERILALQAEGHPIFPGSTGENLTLSGLDWDSMVPGAKLQLGDQVLIELTSYTEPCGNIAESFLGQDSSRILQSRFPGWSRLYALVLEQGEIRVGDQVRLE